MTEWGLTRLGDVTSQVQDLVKVVPGDEYPLLGVKLYAAGPFLREVVSSESSKATRFYRVRAGQFIYNRLFAGKGSFGLVSPDLDGSYVSNEFPLFDCDRSRLLPEFLNLHFRQPHVWAGIERVSTGTTASRNRWKEVQFSDYQIPLPPLVQQRRIVDVLAAVDAQVNALQKEVESSRRATKALRFSLLEPQPHWEIVAVGDVAMTATGRAFPDRFQGNATGLLPYFKVADMNASGNERELRSAPNWVTEETIGQLKPRVCPPGTVVFPIIGAAMLTEKRRILVQPSAFDQNVMGLVLNDRVTTDFMFAVMSNLRLRDLSQTGAVPSVNQKLVAAIQFALPPIDEQVAIGEQLHELHVQHESLGAELATLCKFRLTLRTALLNQEIEIPKSYDIFFGKEA